MKLILIFLATILVYNNKPEILSIYTPKDTLHIDKDNLLIFFESSEEEITFDSFDELNEYVENYTVNASIPSGYADNIKYYIDQGAIKIDIEPCINEKTGEVINPIGKTTLYYYGRNWAKDPENDTIFKLGMFHNSEIYDIMYDEFNNRKYNLITITN